jgi:hypothetical protein
MELLFVTLIAFAIGLGIRYVLPGRDTYGSALMPSIAAAVCSVVWVALLWAGWKFDGGWIWVVSLTAGGVSALIVTLALPRTRRSRDSELLQELSRA